MKRSGHVFYNFKQAEDRMIARLTKTQETEAMLVEQPPFHYSYESDFLYDREVEAHQTSEGCWSF